MTALRAIHAGRRQLGIEEEDARDLYERMTGKRSLRLTNEKEREAIISEMRKMGFSKSSSGSRKRLEGKYAPKLQALWIALWNIGAVRNREDAALLAFVKRQTGLDHTRFLHHDADAYKAIEALKGWLKREGVDWATDKLMPDWQKQPGYKIARAQFFALQKAGQHTDYVGLQHWLVVNNKPKRERANAADWMLIMNELGRQIRKQKP